MGPAETTVRVYPNDLDIFLHVNNDVYLTYADLGRTDLMLRSNIFNLI
jgi:acyl-CoA thioesterase FadM